MGLKMFKMDIKIVFQIFKISSKVTRFLIWIKILILSLNKMEILFQITIKTDKFKMVFNMSKMLIRIVYKMFQTLIKFKIVI